MKVKIFVTVEPITIIVIEAPLVSLCLIQVGVCKILEYLNCTIVRQH